MHPAGAALRLRTPGSLVCPRHTAAARRDGGDLCPHRDAGRGRGRLGGAPQRLRPGTGPAAARSLRRRIALQTGGGLDRPAVRGPRQSPGGEYRSGRQRAALGGAGRRHRISLGAVCRPDSGSDTDRRGHQRPECAHDAAAVRLRTRCDQLSGAGDTGGGAHFQGVQVLPGRCRLGSSCSGRSGAGRRGRHRPGLGYGPSDTAVLCEHQPRRAVSARCHSPAGRCAR